MSKTIIATALSENREFKNGKINTATVGSVILARKWTTAVKAMRIPAYAVREYRYNHMGDNSVAPAADVSAVYTALAPVLEMIGEVNGAKLFAENIVDEIISKAMQSRIIDITNEMAHARSEKNKAHKAQREYTGDDADTIAQLQADVDNWDAECERLENEPGNCKRINQEQKETVFVREMEILLGDAINKQYAKSAEQVAAEVEARRKERRAKTAAKKAAKAAQSTNA